MIECFACDTDGFGQFLKCVREVFTTMESKKIYTEKGYRELPSEVLNEKGALGYEAICNHQARNKNCDIKKRRDKDTIVFKGNGVRYKTNRK